MSGYSALTDAEINTKLAEKVGYKHLTDCAVVSGNPWSPCTSRDDLAVVVEHICESRGGWIALNGKLHPLSGTPLFSLTCQPRIIAEVCLGVLNG